MAEKLGKWGYKKMYGVLIALGKLIFTGGFAGVLLFAATASAKDNWELDWELYGWLPIIEIQTDTGEKGEITRDDILDDLDLFGFTFIRAKRGKWSLSSDFVYFDISDKEDAPLSSAVPDLARLDEAGMQAWVIRPALGYTVHEDDKGFVELYAGARYLWIESDLTIDLATILPGSNQRKTSPSDSNWDAIAGVRGSHALNADWSIPYSFNGGGGDSDSTWEAQAAFAYKLKHFDAVAGWRYLYYDVGSDTLIRKLSVNGPFVGAVFSW